MALRNKLMQMLAGCAALILAAACVPIGTGNNGGGTTPLASLEGTTWLLESLNEQPAITSHATASLRVKGSRIFGSAGCNSYSGDYTGTADGEFGAEKMYRTAMLCVPDEIMAQEGAYMAFLNKADKYSIAGNKLTLKAPDGKTAVFTPQSQELAGTAWQATSIEGQSLVSGSSITVSFGNDGKVSGTAGCNRYSGSYAASVSGETVSMSALSATRMLCHEPEGIMAQEQRFLAALQSAASYSVNPRTLTLRAADGSAVVSLRK